MLNFIDKHLKTLLYVQLFSLVLAIIVDIVCIFCYQQKNYLYGFLQLPLLIFNILIFVWFWWVAVKENKWQLLTYLLLIFPTIYVVSGLTSSILLFFNNTHIWSVGIIMMFLLNVIAVCYCSVSLKKNLSNFTLLES